MRSSEPYAVDADAHRQLNIRTVITDVMFQVLDLEDDGVRKALGVFEKEVDTNIGNNLLISLVTRFYDERENVKVYACTGPYLASAVNEQGQPIVTNRVSDWRALMTVVDSGEDPAAVMPQYDFRGSEDDYVKETASSSTASSAAGSSSKGSTSSSTASRASSTSTASSKG